MEVPGIEPATETVISTDINNYNLYVFLQLKGNCILLHEWMIYEVHDVIA